MDDDTPGVIDDDTQVQTHTNAQQDIQDNADEIFGDVMRQDPRFSDQSNQSIQSQGKQQQEEVAEKEQEEDDEEEEDEEPNQTFWSVWQETHREELEVKAAKEKKAKEESIARGKAILEKWTEERQQRLKQERKSQVARESQVKLSYEAVFEHGSTWQQVDELTDLKRENGDDEKTKRMRELIIVLKNQEDENKCDNDGMENIRAICISFTAKGLKEATAMVKTVMQIGGFEEKLYKKDIRKISGSKFKVSMAMMDAGHADKMDDPVINQAVELLQGAAAYKLKVERIPYFVQRKPEIKKLIQLFE